MSFGWSAGDIVAAVSLLNKVRIALKECGGASSDYQEEINFLQSASLTLSHVEALRHAPLDPVISRNLQHQCEMIQLPLQKFLSDARGSFEASLGSSSTRWKIASAPRKLQWALSTSKKVNTLRGKIELSMSAVQLAISQQIMYLLLSFQTTLQLPTDIQLRVTHNLEVVINTAMKSMLETRLTETEVLIERQSQALAAAMQCIQGIGETSQYLIRQQSDTVQRSAEDIVKGIEKVIRRTGSEVWPRVEAIGATEQASGFQNPGIAEAKDELAPLSSSLHLISANLSRVNADTLHLCDNDAKSQRETGRAAVSLEELSSLLIAMTSAQNVAHRQSPSFCLGPRAGPFELPLKELAMSVRLLFNGLRMLIEEFAYILGPWLILCWRLISRPITRISIPQRLLTTLQNGVAFEDALGRSSVLNFEFTLNRVLGCWFDGYPGQSSVTEGLYFILNAQKSGQIISSEIWAEVAKPGARINMSIAVRKTRGISDVCPACGAEQTGKMLSPRPFVSITCSTCNLEYFPNKDESVEKLHDALAQAFLLLTKGKGIVPAQPHQARNVPSPKIAKAQADIQGYQIKGDSSSLDDEMGQDDDDIKDFKKIHLFHDSIEQSSEETRPLSVPQQKTKYSEHRVWDTGIKNEREAARQFWLGLDAEDRQTLVKAEKTTILEKMKAQQKHTCDCSVCSRKRIAIEDELEPLYNSYYEEAERFSSSPTKEAVDASSSTGSDPSDDAGPDKLKGSPVKIHLTESRSNHSGQSDVKGDDENMDLYTDIAPDFSSLGIFPSVKGGLVSVADDVLKNDEKKFIEMMEQLALRQKAREKAMEDDAPSHAVQTRGFGAEESDGEDEYEDCGNEKMTEDQRMEEGRRVFRTFAARLFEQRVIRVYREKAGREQ